MGQSPDSYFPSYKDLPAGLIYLSSENCNICKILRPKVEELLQKEFPKMRFFYIDINKSPDIAAQLSVFSIPTVICYFEGKEFFRKSRAFGISELAREIKRPYNLLFKLRND